MQIVLEHVPLERQGGAHMDLGSVLKNAFESFSVLQFVACVTSRE